jgi:hypothetical protein
MTAIRWRHDTPEDYVDVFTFHRQERLAIHEARTVADLHSAVVRHAAPVRRKLVQLAERSARRRAERRVA